MIPFFKPGLSQSSVEQPKVEEPAITHLERNAEPFNKELRIGRSNLFNRRTVHKYLTHDEIRRAVVKVHSRKYPDEAPLVNEQLNEIVANLKYGPIMLKK